MGYQVAQSRHAMGPDYPDQLRHEPLKFHIALPDLHQISRKLFFSLIPNGIGPKNSK
jgi:hypothetical protein